MPKHKHHHLSHKPYDPDHHSCANCGKPATEYTVDPYKHEMYGDTRKDWYCGKCLQDSADDI